MPRADERVTDARAEQPGADDAHRAAHARSQRTRGTRRRAHRFAHSVSWWCPTRSAPSRLCRRRLVGRAARECQQSAAFHLSQLARPAHWEGSQVQRAELPPYQLDDGVPDGRHHAPHDAVATRVQGELDRASRRRSAELESRSAPCRRRSVRLRARCPACSVAIVCARDLPLDLRDVHLGDAERRVREHVGELAVVREHEQAARVGIQSAHVVEPFLPVLGELAQIGPAALVAHRADHAARAC